MEIITKTLDNGDVIYSAQPPKGTRLKYPIGYFKTEDEAVSAYNTALNQ